MAQDEASRRIFEPFAPPPPAWVTEYCYPRITSDFHRIDEWGDLKFFKLLNDIDHGNNTEVVGLILQKTNVSGTYRRVGTAVRISESWIKTNVALSEVTIV
jgi:hypothetical protein